MPVPTYTYGLGGWMPDQPGENIEAITTDNGDGTKTVRRFDAQGNETSVETVEIEGWTPPEPSKDDEIAAARANLAKASNVAAIRAASLALFDLLTPEGKP